MPFISLKPSSSYVRRPYVPNTKQINNKAYIARIAKDRAYVTKEGK
jgi:hypothetical protein